MVRTTNTFEETEEMQRWEGFNLSFLYVQLRIHFLQAVKIILISKHQLLQKILKCRSYSADTRQNIFNLQCCKQYYLLRGVLTAFFISTEMEKDLSAPCMHVKSDIEHRNDDHGKYMILERDLWFVTLRHHQHIGIVDLLLIASSKQ